MKNSIHNICTIILSIAVIVIGSKIFTQKNDIDYYNKILNFYKAEDSREINKILNFYQFPVSKYWNKEKLTQNQIKRIYLSSWKIKEFSKNNILNIDKSSNLEYVITTKYDYIKTQKNKILSSVVSDIKITFNKKGKISSIGNITNKKISGNYSVSKNQKTDFYLKKVTTLERYYLLNTILIMVLILNLITQLYSYLKKNKKTNETKFTGESKNKNQESTVINFTKSYDKYKDDLKEQEIQERYREGNKKRLRNLELKRKERQKQKDEERIKKEEKELNRLIALEEKEKRNKLNKLKREKQSKKERLSKKNTIKTDSVLKKEKKQIKLKANEQENKKSVLRGGKKQIKTKANEQENKKSVLRRVNFSTYNIITCKDQYPIVRKPKYNSIIRSHRLGRNKRKGFKEDELFYAIKEHFYNDFDVINNALIAIGEGITPYEPDIAMIFKGQLNINIDIEIDEPYAGVSRKLTHCYPSDIARDNYFEDRGWFVIRFSEYQVHHQINECLLEIANVLEQISQNFKYKSLSYYGHINKEYCWSEHQAALWESINYRENYLNHHFKPFKESTIKIDTSLTTFEQKEESLVISTYDFITKEPNKIYNKPKITYNKPKITYNNVTEYKKSTPRQKEYTSNNYSIDELINLAIKKEKSIEMKYTNWNGETSIRKVSNLKYTEEFLQNGYSYKEHIKGYCHKRLEERSFKLTRISFLKILD